MMTDITAAHFFVGTLGLSMIRRWYEDGDFNQARMAELRQLLDNLDQFPQSLVLNPAERDLLDGYREWADSYDGPNPLIADEEPIIQPMLARLGGPGTRALDAACGTGRHAAYLAGLGGDVAGVDQSPSMLEVACAKAPTVDFRDGDIRALPFAEGSFDLAVISLALCHLDDPAAAIRELARVLRVGGSLVISEPHPDTGFLGGQAFYGGIVPGRAMTWVRNYRHSASTWLSAFRHAGLEVEECHEVPLGEAQAAASPAMLVYPDAARAAIDGLCGLWLWLVTKTGP